MVWDLEIHPAAVDELVSVKAKDEASLRKLLERFSELAATHKPHEAMKPLSGPATGLFRLKAGTCWAIVDLVSENRIIIVSVRWAATGKMRVVRS